MRFISTLVTRAVVPLVAVACTHATCFAEETATGMSDASLDSKSLWDMLLAGGPLMLPIVVCSFVLLLVVFERTVSLRRSRVVPRLVHREVSAANWRRSPRPVRSRWTAALSTTATWLMSSPPRCASGESRPSKSNKRSRRRRTHWQRLATLSCE